MPRISLNDLTAWIYGADADHSIMRNAAILIGIEPQTDNTISADQALELAYRTHKDDRQQFENLRAKILGGTPESTPTSQRPSRQANAISYASNPQDVWNALRRGAPERVQMSTLPAALVNYIHSGGSPLVGVPKESEAAIQQEWKRRADAGNEEVLTRQPLELIHVLNQSDFELPARTAAKRMGVVNQFLSGELDRRVAADALRELGVHSSDTTMLLSPSARQAVEAALRAQGERRTQRDAVEQEQKSLGTDAYYDYLATGQTGMSVRTDDKGSVQPLTGPGAPERASQPRMLADAPELAGEPDNESAAAEILASITSPSDAVFDIYRKYPDYDSIFIRKSGDWQPGVSDDDKQALQEAWTTETILKADLREAARQDRALKRALPHLREYLEGKLTRPEAERRMSAAGMRSELVKAYMEKVRPVADAYTISRTPTAQPAVRTSEPPAAPSDPPASSADLPPVKATALGGEAAQREYEDWLALADDDADTPASPSERAAEPTLDFRENPDAVIHALQTGDGSNVRWDTVPRDDLINLAHRMGRFEDIQLTNAAYQAIEDARDVIQEEQDRVREERMEKEKAEELKTAYSGGWVPKEEMLPPLDLPARTKSGGFAENALRKWVEENRFAEEEGVRWALGRMGAEVVKVLHSDATDYVVPGDSYIRYGAAGLEMIDTSRANQYRRERGVPLPGDKFFDQADRLRQQIKHKGVMTAGDRRKFFELVLSGMRGNGVNIEDPRLRPGSGNRKKELVETFQRSFPNRQRELAFMLEVANLPIPNIRQPEADIALDDYSWRTEAEQYSTLMTGDATNFRNYGLHGTVMDLWEFGDGTRDGKRVVVRYADGSWLMQHGTAMRERTTGTRLDPIPDFEYTSVIKSTLRHHIHRDKDEDGRMASWWASDNSRVGTRVERVAASQPTEAPTPQEQNMPLNYTDDSKSVWSALREGNLDSVDMSTIPTETLLFIHKGHASPELPDESKTVIDDALIARMEAGDPKVAKIETPRDYIGVVNEMRGYGSEYSGRTAEVVDKYLAGDETPRWAFEELEDLGVPSDLAEKVLAAGKHAAERQQLSDDIHAKPEKPQTDQPAAEDPPAPEPAPHRPSQDDVFNIYHKYADRESIFTRSGQWQSSVSEEDKEALRAAWSAEKELKSAMREASRTDAEWNRASLVLSEYIGGDLSDEETERRLLDADLSQDQLEAHMEKLRPLSDAIKFGLVQQAEAKLQESMRKRSGRQEELSGVQKQPAVVQEQAILGEDFANNQQLGMIVEITDPGAKDPLTSPPATPEDDGQSHFLEGRAQPEALTEVQETERNTGKAQRKQDDSAQQHTMTEPTSPDELGALWERYASTSFGRRRNFLLLTSDELAKPPDERQYPPDFHDWMREQGLEPPAPRQPANTPPKEEDSGMNFSTTAEFREHYESMSDEHREGFDDYMRENGLGNTSELSELNAAMELYHEESQDYLWEEEAPARVRQTNTQRTPHVQPPLESEEEEAQDQPRRPRTPQVPPLEGMTPLGMRPLDEPSEQTEEPPVLIRMSPEVRSQVEAEQRAKREEAELSDLADSKVFDTADINPYDTYEAMQQRIESGDRRQSIETDPLARKEDGRFEDPHAAKAAIADLPFAEVRQLEQDEGGIVGDYIRDVEIERAHRAVSERTTDESTPQAQASQDPLARDEHGYFVDEDAATVAIENMPIEEVKQLEPDMGGAVNYWIGKDADAERETEIDLAIKQLNSKPMAELESLLFEGDQLDDRHARAISAELQRRGEETKRGNTDLTDFTDMGLGELETDIRGREEYADLKGRIEQEWHRRQDAAATERDAPASVDATDHQEGQEEVEADNPFKHKSMDELDHLLKARYEDEIIKAVGGERHRRIQAAMRGEADISEFNERGLETLETEIRWQDGYEDLQERIAKERQRRGSAPAEPNTPAQAEDSENQAEIEAAIGSIKQKSMAELDSLLDDENTPRRLVSAASTERRRRLDEALHGQTDLSDFTETGLSELEASIDFQDNRAELQERITQERERRQGSVGHLPMQDQTEPDAEQTTEAQVSYGPLGDADDDGLQNFEDPDDDNDRVPDVIDSTPQGGDLPGERLEQFRRVPLEQIKIRADLFQFRKVGREGVHEADVQQLYEIWDDNKAKAIQVVWVDGEWAVVEGHHRYMAKRLVEADPEKNALHESGLKVEILDGDTSTPEGRAAIRTQALAGNYEHRDIRLATQVENFRELIEMEHNGINTPGQAGRRLKWPPRKTEQITTLMHLPSNILYSLEQDEDLIRYALDLGQRVQIGMFTSDQAWAYWKAEVDVESRPGIGRFRDDLHAIARVMADANVTASDMFAEMDEGQFAGELSYSPSAKAMLLRAARLADIKQERTEFRGYRNGIRKIVDKMQLAGLDLTVADVTQLVENRLDLLEEYEQRAAEGDLTPIPEPTGLVKAVQENGEALKDPDSDGIPNAVDIDDDGDGIPDKRDDTPRGDDTMPHGTDEEEGRPTAKFGTEGITGGGSIMDDEEEEKGEPQGPQPGQIGLGGGTVNEEGELKGDTLEGAPDAEDDTTPEGGDTPIGTETPPPIGQTEDPPQDAPTPISEDTDTPIGTETPPPIGQTEEPPEDAPTPIPEGTDTPIGTETPPPIGQTDAPPISEEGPQPVMDEPTGDAPTTARKPGEIFTGDDGHQMIIIFNGEERMLGNNGKPMSQSYISWEMGAEPQEGVYDIIDGKAVRIDGPNAGEVYRISDEELRARRGLPPKRPQPDAPAEPAQGGSTKTDGGRTGTLRPDELGELLGGLSGAIGSGARQADHTTRMRQFLSEGVPISPESIVRQYGNDDEAIQILQNPNDAFGMSEAEAKAVIDATKGNAPDDYQQMLGRWRQRILDKRQAFIDKKTPTDANGKEATPTEQPAPTPTELTGQTLHPIGGEQKFTGTVYTTPLELSNIEKVGMPELGKLRDDFLQRTKAMPSGSPRQEQAFQGVQAVQKEIDRRIKEDPSLSSQLSTGSAAPDLPPQGTPATPNQPEAAPPSQPTTTTPTESTATPNPEAAALIESKQTELETLNGELSKAQDYVVQLNRREETLQTAWEGTEPGSEQKESVEDMRAENSRELSRAEEAVNRLESSRDSAQAALNRMRASAKQGGAQASANGAGAAPPPPPSATGQPSSNGTGGGATIPPAGAAQGGGQQAGPQAGATPGNAQRIGSLIGKLATGAERLLTDEEGKSMREAEGWFRRERNRLMGMRRDQGYEDLLPDDIYYLHMGRNDYRKTGAEPTQQTPDAAYPPPKNETDALAAQHLREKAYDEMKDMRGRREDKLEKARLRREAGYQERVGRLEGGLLDQRRQDRLAEGESEEQRSEARQERRFERTQRRIEEGEMRRERRAEDRAMRQSARAWGGQPPRAGYGGGYGPQYGGPSQPGSGGSQVFSDLLDSTVGEGTDPFGEAGPAGAGGQSQDWYRRRDRFGRFAPGGRTPPPRTPRKYRPGSPLPPGGAADGTMEYGDEYESAAAGSGYGSGYGAPAHPPGCKCPNCGGGIHAAGCTCSACSVSAADDRDVHVTLNFDSQNISDSQNADNASEVVIKQRPKAEPTAAPVRSEEPRSGRGDAAVQLRTAMFPYKEGEISYEEAADRLRDMGVRSDDIEPTLNRFDDYAYGKPLTLPNRVLDAITRHQAPPEDAKSEQRYGKQADGEQADGGHNKSIVINEGGNEKPQKTLSAAMLARANGGGGGESAGRKRSSGTASTKRSARASSGPKKASSSAKPKKTSSSRGKGKGKGKSRMAKSMLGG